MKYDETELEKELDALERYSWNATIWSWINVVASLVVLIYTILVVKY